MNKQSAQIEEMRARVQRYDMLAEQVAILEVEIAGIQNYLKDGRTLKCVTIQLESGTYPTEFITRPVLTMAEISSALLPGLESKLAAARKELEAL